MSNDLENQVLKLKAQVYDLSSALQESEKVSQHILNSLVNTLSEKGVVISEDMTGERLLDLISENVACIKAEDSVDSVIAEG